MGDAGVRVCGGGRRGEGWDSAAKTSMFSKILGGEVEFFSELADAAIKSVKMAVTATDPLLLFSPHPLPLL